MELEIYTRLNTEMMTILLLRFERDSYGSNRFIDSSLPL